jgi:glycosyltransferase involved in cell wall biosynthesis
MDLSIIVPLYNEEENVRLLYKAIVQAIAHLDLSYEIIFVDDGSKDNTFAIAKTLSQTDPHLRIIKFRKNCGQTPAMAAGIDHARGALLITMDGDLQNDPRDIPNFIAKINEGFDIVVGWRHKRQDKLVSRKIPSQIANWMIGKVTGVSIRDNGCSLKAYRANVIKNVPLYSEMHRFIPAMTSLAGARIAEIKVRHHARQFGISKYGLSRVYKVLLDLLTIKTIVTFSTQPLLWFALLALPAACISITSLLISLYMLFFFSYSLPIPITGIGILFGALTFFLFMGGIFGELVTRTGDATLFRLSGLTARIYQSKNQSNLI